MHGRRVNWAAMGVESEPPTQGRRLACVCLASPSARPVFVGNFVASFVGERTVDNVSDKVSEKGNVSEGGAKHIPPIGGEGRGEGAGHAQLATGMTPGCRANPPHPGLLPQRGEGVRSAFGVRRFDVRPKQFAWLF